jgi:hypothetical protein
MARDKGVLRLTNPWPRFAWLAAAHSVAYSLDEQHARPD